MKCNFFIFDFITKCDEVDLKRMESEKKKELNHYSNEKIIYLLSSAFNQSFFFFFSAARTTKTMMTNSASLLQSCSRWKKWERRRLDSRTMSPALRTQYQIMIRLLRTRKLSSLFKKLLERIISFSYSIF